MNYKSEFQLLLTAYESILPFDMHVKFSLTLMGVTRAYYGITRPLGVNIYFRQTALLKFIKKKRERRRYQWEEKNPLWVLWKQKYHSVHFWSAGGSEKKKSCIGIQLHPCTSFFQHIRTRVKMCTSTCVLVRASLCSVTPNFGASPSLSSCKSAQLHHSPWTAQFTPAERVTRGLRECWKSWVSPPGSLWSSCCSEC